MNSNGKKRRMARTSVTVRMQSLAMTGMNGLAAKARQRPDENSRRWTEKADTGLSGKRLASSTVKTQEHNPCSDAETIRKPVA